MNKIMEKIVLFDKNREIILGTIVKDRVLLLL